MKLGSTLPHRPALLAALRCCRVCVYVFVCEQLRNRMLHMALTQASQYGRGCLLKPPLPSTDILLKAIAARTLFYWTLKVTYGTAYCGAGCKTSTTGLVQHRFRHQHIKRTWTPYVYQYVATLSTKYVGNCVSKAKGILSHWGAVLW